MIENIDQRIGVWAESVLAGVELSFAAPQALDKKPLIGVYLLDLLPAPSAPITRRRPLQIALRYLITTSAPAPEDAHRMLGMLAFAAMEEADFEVELEPLSATLWQAFGVPPRPSFRLCVPVVMERPEPVAPRVRRPVDVRHSPLTALAGLVLGPGDLPLPNIEVALPSVGLSTLTDAAGRFRFAPIPGDTATGHFRLRAKGTEVMVEPAPKPAGPLILRFDAMES